MNRLFAGMITMLLALATLASAAPEKLAKAGDQAAEKQTAEQKRSRSKGQAHTGGNHKVKKDTKPQTGTVPPVK